MPTEGGLCSARETQVVIIKQLTPRAARTESTLPESTATATTPDELLQASAVARQPGTSGFRALVASQTAAGMLPVAAPSGRASQVSRVEAQPPSPEASPQQEPLQPRDPYMALCLAVKDEVRLISDSLPARSSTGLSSGFSSSSSNLSIGLSAQSSTGLSIGISTQCSSNLRSSFSCEERPILMAQDSPIWQHTCSDNLDAWPNGRQHMLPCWLEPVLSAHPITCHLHN